MQTLKRLWGSNLEHHHHDRRKNDPEVRLTHVFMRIVVDALRAIIHKLNLILERLPEPSGKPTKMEIKFGEPEQQEKGDL